MSDWKTLDGIDIENIYAAIRNEVKKVDDGGGIVFAYIGTDGQNLGKKSTSFVQCVALHKFDENGIGKGGRVFFVRHLEKPYVNRKQRLLREAELSINLAQKLEPLFSELDIPFEVHADVNSVAGKNKQNKSFEVHDTIKGWIESMGWVCKTKPQAFVASIVADRHTRSIRSGKNHFRKQVNRRKGV
jgi:predicted RNase H-related nuclease YkuK (DUF458 family)